MKKIFCALLLAMLMASAAFADVAITAENFPDSNFRAYVSETFDTDGNGTLSDSEISDITEIRVSSLREDTFGSVKGIEHFPNLAWLSVPNQEITSLDLSMNIKLVSLDCSSNWLSELDLSQNTELRIVSCAYNQLKTLDLSGSPKIYSVYVAYNQLTELNISGNRELESLACQGNLLTELDLSNKSKLTTLYCAQNRLKALDVSDCVVLDTISIEQNSLAAFDLPREASLPIYIPNPIVPHSSYAATQRIDEVLRLSRREDSSYPYALDFTEYMTASQILNISADSVQGFDETGNEIETVYENGVAKFTKLPTYDLEECKGLL